MKNATIVYSIKRSFVKSDISILEALEYNVFQIQSKPKKTWISFVIISHYVNILIFTVFIVLFAIWICEKASTNLLEKDHKSIVIDELAGMWVALVPVLYVATDQNERILYASLAFIFFRIFDILKPFPISYFDTKYKNGLGIVLDDVIAGIFAAIISLVLTIFLI